MFADNSPRLTTDEVGGLSRGVRKGELTLTRILARELTRPCVVYAPKVLLSDNLERAYATYKLPTSPS